MIARGFALAFVSAGAFMGIASPAIAMDCAKAATPIEKAICADPKLKAQDAALGRYYFETLRGLMGERHDTLIVDQRRWLQETRASDCAPSDKGAALGPCLAASLTARLRGIAICFGGAQAGAAELAGKPITPADLCPAYLHAGCPLVSAQVSARLTTYPWLLYQMVESAKKDADSGDCGPESADSPGTPDQNESNETATVLAERPNFVSVRYEDDSMSRGAAHPAHDERVIAYDTRTKAAIPVAALLPPLKAGSKLLEQVSAAANRVLDPSCCVEDNEHNFRGIGLDTDQPIPDGWSVTDQGDLLLAYSYNALGREFLATAIIPRALVIDAVDPKYAAFFVKTATPAPTK